jgi:hypothetical protein
VTPAVLTWNLATPVPGVVIAGPPVTDEEMARFWVVVPVALVAVTLACGVGTPVAVTLKALKLPVTRPSLAGEVMTGAEPTVRSRVWVATPEADDACSVIGSMPALVVFDTVKVACPLLDDPSVTPEGRSVAVMVGAG